MVIENIPLNSADAITDYLAKLDSLTATIEVLLGEVE